jgi:hypothetical protein
MRISIRILLIFWMLPLGLAAQEEQVSLPVIDTANLFINRLTADSLGPSLHVRQDPRLTLILRKHYDFNRSAATPGWGILIYKGREMSRANQVKAEFEEAFGELNLKVDVEYNEPDFSTLVGTFRSREDAYHSRQALLGKFPQAYLVPIRIRSDQ